MAGTILKKKVKQKRKLDWLDLAIKMAVITYLKGGYKSTSKEFIQTFNSWDELDQQLKKERSK